MRQVCKALIIASGLFMGFSAHAEPAAPPAALTPEELEKRKQEIMMRRAQRGGAAPQASAPVSSAPASVPPIPQPIQPQLTMPQAVTSPAPSAPTTANEVAAQPSQTLTLTPAAPTPAATVAPVQSTTPEPVSTTPTITPKFQIEMKPAPAAVTEQQPSQAPLTLTPATPSAPAETPTKPVLEVKPEPEPTVTPTVPEPQKATPETLKAIESGSEAKDILAKTPNDLTDKVEAKEQAEQKVEVPEKPVAQQGQAELSPQEATTKPLTEEPVKNEAPVGLTPAPTAESSLPQPNQSEAAQPSLPNNPAASATPPPAVQTLNLPANEPPQQALPPQANSTAGVMGGGPQLSIADAPVSADPSKKVTLPPMQNSVMFRANDLDKLLKIYELMLAKQDSSVKADSQARDIAESLIDKLSVKNQKPEEKTPEIEAIYLSSIIYRAPGNALAWINGNKTEIGGTLDNFKLVNVTDGYALISWEIKDPTINIDRVVEAMEAKEDDEADLKKRKEQFKAKVSQIIPSIDTKKRVVTFRLKPNQTFLTRSLTVREGKVSAPAATATETQANAAQGLISIPQKPSSGSGKPGLNMSEYIDDINDGANKASNSASGKPTIAATATPVKTNSGTPTLGSPKAANSNKTLAPIEQGQQATVPLPSPTSSAQKTEANKPSIYGN